MRNLVLSTLLGTLLATGLFAQAQNDAALSLVVNGVDQTPPNQVTVIKPGSVSLKTTTASANVPYALLLGTAFQNAALDFGVIQVDLANVQILIDGISPTSFLDFLANTGAAKESTFSFPIPTTINNGLLAAFQVVGLEPTGPFGVADSAAAEIYVDNLCDFGSVLYGRGVSTSTHSSFFVDSQGANVQYGLPSAVYDMESLNPTSWNFLIGNASAPGNIFRERSASLQPFSNQESASFEFIKTIHGDLYHFEDVVTGEWGFFIVPGAGAPPVEIPGSRRMNPGSTTTSPWEIEVSISIDQSTMAAVYDPTNGSDELWLMKLDGTTFPGGASVANVTPLTAPTAISEDSVTIVNGNCYFVDGAATNGFLYRADAVNPGPAQLVTLPNTGTTLPAITVDHEMYFHPASQLLILQAGASLTTEDIYAIQSISPGVDVITNCSNFPTSTEIEEFGDAYDGIDGLVGVSPDGTKVCFVVQATGTIEDLFWTTTDGTMTAVNLTPDAVMASANDSFIDINFYANDAILFFCGTTTTTGDLFHVDISGTPAYVNVTATSGSTTVPFASGGTIDGDGFVTLSDRMIFARDGTLSSGPNSGLTTAFNLIGVLYGGPNALQPFNITGDEWPTTIPGSGTAANTSETVASALELVFAPGADILWFKSSVLPSTTNEDLWVYDATSTAPAFRFGLDAAGAVIDNLRPDDTGFTCLFSYETTGDEEVYQAIFGLPGAVQLTDDPTNPSNDVADGTIRYFDPTAGCQGFVFVRGASSTSVPDDANLFGYDFGTSTEFTIVDTIANYWVFGVSYP